MVRVYNPLRFFAANTFITIIARRINILPGIFSEVANNEILHDGEICSRYKQRKTDTTENSNTSSPVAFRAIVFNLIRLLPALLTPAAIDTIYYRSPVSRKSGLFSCGIKL